MIKQLSSTKVYKNAWMQIDEDTVQFENGHQGIYGVVQKNDFALIIPYENNRFTMIQQYRYPIQKVSIEFPQGMHEENSHISPSELAKSELLEETGIVSKNMQVLGCLNLGPGYIKQNFHIFLATGLTYTQKHPEITESEIETITFTQKEIENKIISGEITDSPSVASYGLWKILQERHAL
jgi:8-oxo-dGTP pyrophosphatase MutT (NUDIX family)